MPLKYIVANWKFDAAKWAQVIKRMTNDNVGEWAQLMGVNAATLSAWRNMDKPNRNPQPTIANLLLVCNALDLDPREFFCLDLPETTDEQ